MLYIKSLTTIRTMAEGGKILFGTLEALKNEIKPGISTKELNKIAERYIIANGAKPTFKGYEGYPAAICTSPNHVVIHGIPSSEVVLKEGDIISLDIGVCYKGYHTDGARTFPVGEIKESEQKLIKACEDSFYIGMQQARVGNRISDIGSAIEQFITPMGYGIVRDFTGHGVGNELHESPAIPNYHAGRGIRILEGMTLAIEPMINEGTERVKILRDGWTTVTADNKPSAHYENTVAVVGGEPIILTAPDVSI